MYYVYRYMHPDYPWLYVGKTKDLKGRILSHDSSIYDNIERKYANLLLESTVYYMEFDNSTQMSLVELYLIDKHKPHINKKDKHDNCSSLKMNLPKWKRFIRNYDISDFENGEIRKDDVCKQSQDCGIIRADLSLLKHPEFVSLNSRRKLLFLIICLHYAQTNDTYNTFSFTINDAIRNGGLYTKNMHSEFYNDMRCLESAGFIKKIKQGGGYKRAKNLWIFCYSKNSAANLDAIASVAGLSLSPVSRDLFRYMELECLEQNLGIATAGTEFTFSRETYSKKYKIAGNGEQFNRKMHELIEKGFIELVFNGKTSRKKNIYAISSKWENWTEGDDYRPLEMIREDERIRQRDEENRKERNKRIILNELGII